jgi:hypothetical protein
MKKAEIIKNGNVNLNPIKTGIDWDRVLNNFLDWESVTNYENDPVRIFDWFKKRIEKELNQK